MKQTVTVALILFLRAIPLNAQHEHHSPDSNAELKHQIEAVRRGTERYRQHANAVADGYRLFGGDGPLMGEHWYHPELVRQPLDLTRPATLQYAIVRGERVLVGVAYNVYQRPGAALPEGFAGPQDHWHVHDLPKLARALLSDRPVLRRIVDRRADRGKIGAGDHRSQLVMLHTWVWSENPDGLFAQQHRALPYLRAGLPIEWAKQGPPEAAWGVALLQDGCSFEMERLNRLAKLKADQQRELRDGCARAESAVRSAVKQKSEPLVNEAAASAWRRFTELRDHALTAEQKARLQAVMEPMIAH